MFTLFTAPSSTDIWTGVSNYSGDTFSNLLPLVYIAVGFLVGAVIVSFLIGAIVKAVYKVTGKGRGGRRGGRRGR